VNINDKNYLELTNGFIHEKNKDQNITVVKFDKTIFDFTKYQTGVTKYIKLQERSTIWLFDNYLKNTKETNILEEIHKRIFKPLFIPIISILCCFLLYTNNEKINSTKLKIFIFSISTILIIFIEVLIGISIKNNFFQIFFYSLPIIGIFFVFYILKNFLKNEPIYK